MESPSANFLARNDAKAGNVFLKIKNKSAPLSTDSSERACCSPLPPPPSALSRLGDGSSLPSGAKTPRTTFCDAIGADRGSEPPALSSPCRAEHVVPSRALAGLPGVVGLTCDRRRQLVVLGALLAFSRSLRARVDSMSNVLQRLSDTPKRKTGEKKPRIFILI